MISSILRFASVVCSLVVLLSFAMFASDQAGKGSSHQVAEVAAGADTSAAAARPVNVDQPAPTPAVERMRQKRHSAPRELVDDADDFLLSPFTGFVTAKSIWAQRIIEGLLALAVFGFGLSFLGRWASLRGA